MNTKLLFATLALAALPVNLYSQQPPAVITVDAAHPGAAISPQMFGIFFEDINFGADGGLYPELVKNRSFEFDQPLAGWKEVLSVGAGGIASPKGEIAVHTEDPLNASNPHYLRVTDFTPGLGLTNAGYRGMGIKGGAEYRFSAWARISPRTTGPNSIRASITVAPGPNGQPWVIGAGTLKDFSANSGWHRYETTIKAFATADHASLTLNFDEPGTLDIDMVSLYPVDTWNQRPYGLRKDIVQLLVDLHPGFLRFPGGCIVEGRQLATRYRWKNTIGDISQRQTIINRWNDEFDHRPTPDYFQSFGLGFYEYFQLAEDIGARPLPILNCGMACEFNSNETAALSDLHEYIQDALDLIDFANGPVTSPWGKLRATMGHPEPFHMEMLGVGNEQWGPHYLERYKLFEAALKAAHPEIKLVVSAGPSPDGEIFDSSWANWRTLHADIVDEHYYMSPDWFLKNSGRYDRYDRSGPKVFAGEYAAQTVESVSPNNRNNWRGALSEAAFMTGLERNGDVVRMASYAPLLAHKDAWQWTPDLIWFDNLRSYGTPNYYVQQIFSRNVGTRNVPVTPQTKAGLYTVASVDDRTNELVVTAVNTTAAPMPAQIQLGLDSAAPVQVTTLSSPDLAAENNFDHPTAVAPITSTTELKSGSIAAQLPPYSVTVYRVPMK